MAKPSAQPSSGGIEVQSLAETERLAETLAQFAKPGDVIGLSGALGAGKTAFARAFIRAWTGVSDEEVPSPTFTLVQIYDGVRGTVWHIDLYRLNDPEEVYELGLDDAMADGVALIEWPSKLGPACPEDWLEINLAAEGAGPEARRITLVAHGSRAAVLVGQIP